MSRMIKIISDKKIETATRCIRPGVESLLPEDEAAAIIKLGAREVVAKTPEPQVSQEDESTEEDEVFVPRPPKRTRKKR